MSNQFVVALRYEETYRARHYTGGVKYALLPKTTRGNTVEGRITLRIGDEKRPGK